MKISQNSTDLQNIIKELKQNKESIYTNQIMANKIINTIPKQHLKIKFNTETTPQYTKTLGVWIQYVK